MKIWLIGILVTAALGLLALLVRVGIPLFVGWIARVASARTKRLLRALAPLVVQLVEVLSKEFNWKGEDKMVEALARLAEEIGRQLTPSEEEVALLAIKEEVSRRNKASVALLGTKEFVEMVKVARVLHKEG